MNKKYLWIILPLVAALLAVPAIADNISDIQVSVTVPTYVSVVFNYNTVNFGQVSATGVTDLEAPNGASGVYNVSVATNVPLNVSLWRSGWIGPGNVLLTLKIATATTISGLSSATRYVISASPVTIATNLPTGSYTHYHDYFLTVPAYADPGTYSTTVEITYAAA